MRPVNPVLTAFMEDFAFPSGVVGPWEDWAFVRLAANWAADAVVMIWILLFPICCEAPETEMARAE